MNTFSEMEQSGRESRLTIISENLSLDDEINGKSLVDIIENWLNTNTVRGRFTTDNTTENRMDVSQAMMPLFQQEKSLDARNFYKQLVSNLNALLTPKGHKASMTKRKLAEVEITIK